MSTDTDLVAKELLEVLVAQSRLAPSELAEKTGLKHQQVKTTLRILAELLLVETPVRGIYVITEEGRIQLQLLLQHLGENEK